MKTGTVWILVLSVFVSRWILPVKAETSSQAEFDAQALDAYVSGQMSKHGIQGISLAVTSKTEIDYLKGCGTLGMNAR